MWTYAFDASDKDKDINVDEHVTVTDEINYTGLKEGMEYTLVSEMHLEDGRILTKDNEPVGIFNHFTADEDTGSCTASITFDTTGLEGKKLTVYEYLFEGNIEEWSENYIASHADAASEKQTVFVKEPEETESESESESETQTETETESQTEKQSESDTETDSESETSIITETQPKKPGKPSPKTGDSFDLALSVIMAVSSLTVLVLTMIAARKKR